MIFMATSLVKVSDEVECFFAAIKVRPPAQMKKEKESNWKAYGRLVRHGLLGNIHFSSCPFGMLWRQTAIQYRKEPERSSRLRGLGHTTMPSGILPAASATK
jgi:hypothetical protein